MCAFEKPTVRKRSRGLGLSTSVYPCIVAGLSLLTVGCHPPGRPDPADRPVPADQVMDFAVLYRKNCSGCHGAEGKLGPAPPLNDPLFRAIVPEEELAAIVTSGRENTLMPAFAKENGGPLTTAQIQVLVKEIKGIPYRLVEKEEAGDTPPSTPGENGRRVDVVADAGGISPRWGVREEPPKGVPSYRGCRDGTKQRGALVFARACAACHGEHGQGMENGGERRRVINDPVFLALISNQALRRYVITGRPDLGMPSYADARPQDPHFMPLTDQEVTDLVALLASWRAEP